MCFCPSPHPPESQPGGWAALALATLHPRHFYYLNQSESQGQGGEDSSKRPATPLSPGEGGTEWPTAGPTAGRCRPRTPSGCSLGSCAWDVPTNEVSDF